MAAEAEAWVAEGAASCQGMAPVAHPASLQGAPTGCKVVAPTRWAGVVRHCQVLGAFALAWQACQEPLGCLEVAVAASHRAQDAPDQSPRRSLSRARGIWL